jgi:hypothetical protein
MDGGGRAASGIAAEERPAGDARNQTSLQLHTADELARSNTGRVYRVMEFE